MKRFKQIILSVLLLLTIASCKDGNSNLMQRKVSGKISEVVIVMPSAQWEDTIGKVIRAEMTKEHPSLPQKEPMFDLLPCPPAAFTEIFNINRSIIEVNVNSTIDSTSVLFKNNVWAHPQSVVEINAKSVDEFLQLYEAKKDMITRFILQGERNRLMGNYASYMKHEVVQEIKEKFGINLVLPIGFIKASNEKDFYWARFDTPEITQGVMIYTFPYTSDSTFTSDYLVAQRDSLLKAHVEGPAAGSYMISEHQVPTHVELMQFKGKYAAEVRGLWRLEGDWMGGPYILLAVLSPNHERIIVIDGWVYAPQKDKRNYVRQLEAMLYSLSFTEESKE